jgi:photosystem II stability/assembly factor-like uncharacterized protein
MAKMTRILALLTTICGCCLAFASSIPPDLYRVFFVDAHRGYALGRSSDSALVFHTTNGGVTWTKQYRAEENLYGIYFRNSAEGWIVGGKGTLLRTSDGGENWLKSENLTDHDLLAVTSDVLGEIIIVGKGGTVLKSRDNGKNWLTCSIPTTSDLVNLASLPSGLLLVLARNGLFASSDFGVTWKYHGPYKWTTLFAFSFLDSKDGFLSAGPLLRTTNGGETISPVSLPTRQPVTQILITGPSTVFVLASSAESGSVVQVPGENLPSSSIILESDDKGRTWSQVFRIEDKSSHRAFLADMFFLGRYGWAVGANGSVITTEDGGGQWQEIRSTFD